MITCARKKERQVWLLYLYNRWYLEFGLVLPSPLLSFFCVAAAAQNRLQCHIHFQTGKKKKVPKEDLKRTEDIEVLFSAN